MEGFNPQEYRNNLARELNANRASGEAEKILADAQATPEYQILKQVKSAKKEVVAKFGERDFNLENKEIDKAMGKFGFDIIDISEQIPKDIHLMIEQSRIYGQGALGDQERVESFYDQITDHKYLSRKYLNHVSRYNPNFSSLNGTDKENEANENFFGKKRDFTTVIRRGESFYFAAGQNGFLDVNRPLMIFSKENPNFEAYLLSELMDKQNLSDDTEEFIQEKYISSQRSISMKEVLDAISKDKKFEKSLAEGVEIKEKDGEKVYHISDLGYHSEHAPGIVSYLMLTGQNIEFNDTRSGVVLNGGYEVDNMIYSGLFDMKGGKFSFATLADTIVDLPNHRIYKFNKEKFKNPTEMSEQEKEP